MWVPMPTPSSALGRLHTSRSTEGTDAIQQLKPQTSDVNACISYFSTNHSIRETDRWFFFSYFNLAVNFLSVLFRFVHPSSSLPCSACSIVATWPFRPCFRHQPQPPTTAGNLTDQQT
ncbi:hypothetical protein VTI28DRAFT_3767 [Corynascus sepedonium]